MKSLVIGKLRIWYRENTSDMEVILHSFQNEIFLIPEYSPKNGDVILDVGAYIGTFSLNLGSKLKGAKIFAIEPCKDTFSYLKKNIKENALTNVRAFETALSDRKGTTELYYGHDHWGHSITKAFSDRSVTVETDTLENFMRANGICRCDFMRFNCEGAEFRIILNTPRECLQKVKLMLVLYHTDFVTDHSESDLIDYLESCNFSVRVRNRDQHRGWLVATNKELYEKKLLLFREIKYFAHLQLVKVRRHLHRPRPL